MKVFVLDHGAAEQFIPTSKTLAIRIYDSFPDNDGSNSLQASDHWAGILEYTFDDIELDRYSPEYLLEKLPEWEVKFRLFSEELAKKIIDDFSNHLEVPQVMIHCTWGWKRSPATARALERLFKLNFEWGDTRTQRIMCSGDDGVWCGNSYIYKTLCEAL